MSLARRSIVSTGWNIAAQLIDVAILFVRSVLLARWLPVEVFGIYALANSIVTLTAPLPSFGMGPAFLHRTAETQDEERAAAVHFTLKLVFVSLWAVLLTIGALLLADGQDRTALVSLAVIRAGVQLTQTPKLILIRRIVHRRLAIMQVLGTLLATLFALALAWQGVTLWALLVIDLCSLVMNVIVLYVWRPVWRPRLAWSRSVVRYYLRFGGQTVVADLISRALDRVDDIWTGLFLGKVPLSYYSRAYSFATYPRLILAGPVNTVAGGTYAELKEDRKRLSQAFFRINALLIRSGFLLGGVLALVAPEFIRLVLGAKWLPMMDAFRLMLVFTLLDPIKVTVGSLFMAVGKPRQVVNARAIQLTILIVGLFVLGPRLGIVGVALAVNIMLIVGMVILLWRARTWVDFSPRRLFGAPILALVLALGFAYGANTIPGVAGSDWRTGFVKTAVYTLVYGTVLLVSERQQLLEMFSFLTARVLGTTTGGVASLRSQ